MGLRVTLRFKNLRIVEGVQEWVIWEKNCGNGNLVRREQSIE